MGKFSISVFSRHLYTNYIYVSIAPSRTLNMLSRKQYEFVVPISVVSNAF